jgi:hypothetical protein
MPKLIAGIVCGHIIGPLPDSMSEYGFQGRELNRFAVGQRLRPVEVDPIG